MAAADLNNVAQQTQRLLDRQAILDKVYLYCRGLDRLDGDALRDSFHPDAVDHHGDWVGYIPEFIPWAIEVEARHIMTTHHITSHLCEIDGDVAHAESYLIAYVRLANGQQIRSFGGRYIDRFERRGDDWRIALRRLVVDVPFTADAHWFTKYIYVNRDRTDLSYQRPLDLPQSLKDALAKAPALKDGVRRDVDRFPAHIYRGGSNADLSQLAAETQHLSDRLAIRDCVSLYGRALDRRDAGLLAKVFHPDAIISHRDQATPAPEYAKNTLEQESKNLAGLHHITTHSCEISGDTAHAESYALWTLQAPDGQTVKCGTGRYIDRFERRDGKWAIALRRFVHDGGLTLKSYSYERYAGHQGKHDRTDPSYERPLQLPADAKAALANKAKPSAPVRGADAAPTRDLGWLRTKLAYLLDREQILDIQARYARGLDRMDQDAVEAVFHPDGVDNHGVEVWNVPDFARYMLNGQKNNARSIHHMTCHTVSVDGDVAHTETYLLWISASLNNGPIRSGSGRYIDRFERRNGEWRVVLRRFVLDEGLSTPPVSPSGHQMGRRDREDPSYQRPLALPAGVKA